MRTKHHSAWTMSYAGYLGYHPGDLGDTPERALSRSIFCLLLNCKTVSTSSLDDDHLELCTCKRLAVMESKHESRSLSCSKHSACHFHFMIVFECTTLKQTQATITEAQCVHCIHPFSLGLPHSCLVRSTHTA